MRPWDPGSTNRNKSRGQDLNPWTYDLSFPGGWDCKESAFQCREHGFTLGLEDLLEKKMTTHSRILAWEIPWTEEPGRLQSMGSQKSQTWLSDLRFHVWSQTSGFLESKGRTCCSLACAQAPQLHLVSTCLAPTAILAECCSSHRPLCPRIQTLGHFVFLGPPSCVHV